MLGYRLSSLAVDVLGAAGLAYEPQDETAEDDEATTWHIDYMYDIGLIIGGGSVEHPEEHHRRARPRTAARAEGDGAGGGGKV